MIEPRDEQEAAMVSSAEPIRPNSRRYRVISETLPNCLKDGSWSPGAKIPTFRELARPFSVITSTVRNGMCVLEREGKVHHVREVGTFVRPVDTVQVTTDQIMVALAAADLRSPFVVQVTRGVEQACQARRWRLQILDRRLGPQLELDNLSRLSGSGSRGAIIFASGQEDTIEAIFKLKLDGFPMGPLRKLFLTLNW